MERQYIGIDLNATVILNADGSVKTMTGLEWKQYKVEGHDVMAVGALPADINRVMLDMGVSS